MWSRTFERLRGDATAAESVAAAAQTSDLLALEDIDDDWILVPSAVPQLYA
jgi:hypothetical protein